MGTSEVSEGVDVFADMDLIDGVKSYGSMLEGIWLSADWVLGADFLLMLP